MQWVRLPLSALQQLSKTGAIVLALLIDREQDGTARATAAEMAEILGCSCRTIYRSVDELKAAGYVTSVSAGPPTVYNLNTADVLPPKRRYAKRSGSEQVRQHSYDLTAYDNYALAHTPTIPTAQDEGRRRA